MIPRRYGTHDKSQAVKVSRLHLQVRLLNQRELTTDQLAICPASAARQVHRLIRR